MMGAGMGGLGPYGPFVALDRMAAQTQAMQLANQLTGNQLQGQGVLGAAMMQPGFGQGMPGGSPGYNPATPQPGQASQPLQITPNGIGGMGQPMPPDPAQPLQIQAQAGPGRSPSSVQMSPQVPVSGTDMTPLTGPAATQALAGQGAPSGQPGAPAQPSSETGAPGQQQVLSLDKVLGSIVKANPKASPTQIYNAAALYLPFMQEQDQALLRQTLYQTQLERTREIVQGRQNVADTQVAGKLTATQMVQAAIDKRHADTMAGRDQDRAARVQEFAQREQRLGNTANAQRANMLQQELVRQEGIIDQSSFLAQSNPDQAASLVTQAQGQIQALQSQLDALLSQGSGATNAPPGKKVKTSSVPAAAMSPAPMSGAAAPLSGGFQ